MTTTKVEPHRVMVTGHRQLPAEALVASVLRTVLERLRARQSVIAISGMALGADMAFAEAALALDIPLVAAVPMEGQPSRWPSGQRARWQRILDRADRIVEVWREPGYVSGTVAVQFHMRNVWMLDHSDTTIGVWDRRQSGGTWDTIREARKRGRKALLVDPRTGAMQIDTDVVAHSDSPR